MLCTACNLVLSEKNTPSFVWRAMTSDQNTHRCGECFHRLNGSKKYFGTISQSEYSTLWQNSPLFLEQQNLYGIAFVAELKARGEYTAYIHNQRKYMEMMGYRKSLDVQHVWIDDIQKARLAKNKNTCKKYIEPRINKRKSLMPYGHTETDDEWTNKYYNDLMKDV